jgi:SAM-dependent methyltransferase
MSANLASKLKQGATVSKSTQIQSMWFPEIQAGGFSSLDGTLEFYSRINALLQSSMVVLDFGAGRGGALNDGTIAFKKELINLRGKVKKVIACDVDDAVLENPGADETVVIKPDLPLPFESQSFDMIVCDYVFEHIADPKFVSHELERILKPGGWICARTPNKYCLISLSTRLIRNSMHSHVLAMVQPDRRSFDVFPTKFRLNSMRDIQKWFGPTNFDHLTYRYEAEPSYYFNSYLIFTLMLFINWLTPPVMKSGLFVFLRKK